MSNRMERGARAVHAVDSKWASAFSLAREDVPSTRGTLSWTTRVKNRGMTRAALQGVEAAAAGLALAQVATATLGDEQGAMGL